MAIELSLNSRQLTKLFKYLSRINLQLCFFSVFTKKEVKMLEVFEVAVLSLCISPAPVSPASEKLLVFSSEKYK